MRDHLVGFLFILRPLILLLVHLIEVLGKVLLELVGRDVVGQIDLPLTALGRSAATRGTRRAAREAAR